MKESTSDKKVMGVMLGLLVIGGAAAILGMYRATRNAGRRPGYVINENDGEVFVYGAHV
ncbi:MAG: hypothetical protein WBD36_13810 [Bacteroidota bacterium]